jgi:hypothetical protein
MIQPLAQVFSVLAPWWPNQKSDWTEIWSVIVCGLLLPSGTYKDSGQ